MNTRLSTFRWLLISMALVVISFFTGCRAFQPETVVVNLPPETFLTGAPIEHGGGYFHYHMFWYGSDEDGVVERFVWAVTDTTVQDEDTSDDEEDINFNPALDITHLETANWTTKTDSIFDFQINQGTAPSIDMTFHMVAVDDFGDFDRTPARLHFFANTLGSPVISFFRVSGSDTLAMQAGVPDTVGYRQPYHLYWEGMSPNIRGYSSTALAEVDTIAPRNDGLFGFKWQIGGELGGFCVPGFGDCWHPRRYVEATGDSLSFYAPINSLLFMNNGSSSSNPFGMELESGEVSVRVNAVDVAGVEVGAHLREFTFTVNHDPQTLILEGKDWAHAHEADPDTNTYPYYTRLNEADQIHYPIQRGDRIPDRTYVVFKALVRDNADDAVVDPNFKIGMTGIVNGVRQNYPDTDSPYSFSSGASNIDYEPQWDAGLEGWYADTLGFLVGPRTEFSFTMQAVDEHGRRDGTPPSFEFEVGFPPCVQCIELQPNVGTVSEYPMDLACYDPEVPGHDCFDDGEQTFYIPKDDLPLDPGRTYLELQDGGMYLAVSKSPSMAASFVEAEPDGEAYYFFPCKVFSMTVLLHGVDDYREAWFEALNRVRGWKYQVDYDCDPGNKIQDGGGIDDINTPTWGFEHDTQNISINEIDGLWSLTVNFYIPTLLLEQGMEGFFTRVLYFPQWANQNEEVANRLIERCLRQLSHGTVQAIAMDQTDCGYFPNRPAQYHLFDDVRPPRELIGTETWRDCNPNYDTITSLLLKHGTMDSATFDGGGDWIPVEKNFNIIFDDGTDVQCGWTPPAP